MSGDRTFKLSKPIKNTDGKVVEVLTIKEPEASHLMRHGMPVDGDGNINFKVSMDMLQDLTGIHLPALQKMSWPDTLGVVGVLASYFSVEPVADKSSD